MIIKLVQDDEKLVKLSVEGSWGYTCLSPFMVGVWRSTDHHDEIVWPSKENINLKVNRDWAAPARACWFILLYICCEKIGSPRQIRWKSVGFNPPTLVAFAGGVFLQVYLFQMQGSREGMVFSSERFWQGLAECPRCVALVKTMKTHLTFQWLLPKKVHGIFGIW